MSNTQQNEVQKLVTENSVALFMKGSPTFPRCGFSATVAQILKLCGLKEYMAVDMLTRMDIRQELIEYADWPTLPALFVGGEFIGGCDICKEMYESGELQQLLEGHTV